MRTPRSSKLSLRTRAGDLPANCGGRGLRCASPPSSLRRQKKGCDPLPPRGLSFCPCRSSRLTPFRFSCRNRCFPRGTLEQASRARCCRFCVRRRREGRADQAEKANSSERLELEMLQRDLHGMGKSLTESREARRPDFWDFRNILLSLIFRRSFHTDSGTGERQSPVRIPVTRI